jgi:hypothetical protein
MPTCPRYDADNVLAELVVIDMLKQLCNDRPKRTGQVIEGAGHASKTAPARRGQPSEVALRMAAAKAAPIVARMRVAVARARQVLLEIDDELSAAEAV